MQFTLATPFPGSVLYDQMVREGRLRTDDFEQYDGFHTAVVSTEELSSEDLEQILAEANRRWGERFARRTFSTDEADGIEEGETQDRGCVRNGDLRQGHGCRWGRRGRDGRGRRWRRRDRRLRRSNPPM